MVSSCANLSGGNGNDKSSSKDEADKDSDTLKGAVVFYSESQAGGEPFDTRIFANKQFLYITDNRSKSDFLLFNRENKTIYNVNSVDKTIMVIESRPVNITSPIEIDYQEVSQPSGAIPKVDGKQAMHYRYTANGEHCYDAVTLGKDFLPEVGNAMAEFRLVLAGEHAKTVMSTPKEMLNACDLALNVFNSTLHVQHGFPLREWDQTGYRRFLTNYRTDGEIKRQDLELPSDYERFSIP
jgi:hypothetical protein